MFLKLWRKRNDQSSSYYVEDNSAIEENERLVFKCLISAILFFYLASVSVLKADNSVKKEIFHFIIPQQRADRSLTKIAELANITLIFPFDEVKKKRANRIDGMYTVEESLELLLQGTGLHVSAGDNGQLSIVLEKPFGGIDIMRKMSKLSAAIMAMASTAFTVGTASAQQASSLEEVVVTGIRGSLQNAAAIKQNSSSVVDVISAEELGKFPDSNVAESLQRVTGVAIARGRGGEGRFVTIRGLGQEFNGVSYNGRLLATENNGREFSFDLIASELISEAKVYKTAEARLGDGSIGGAVEVKSARPLDQTGTRSAFSLTGQYDDLSEDFGPKLSGVYSNTFNNDTMGVLVSAVYDKREFRVDSSESVDTFTANFDQNGNVFTGAAGQVLTNANARWTSINVGTSSEERERTGATLAFQYQPSDDFSLIADILYTKLDSPGTGFFQTNYTCGACGTVTANSINANNIVTGYTFQGGVEYLGRGQRSESDTTQFGLNADWTVNDKLSFTGDISVSESDGLRDNIGLDAGSGSFYVAGFGGGILTYSANTKDVPNYGINIPTLSGGRASVEAADRTQLGTHFTRETTFTVKDEIFTTKLDGTWDLSDDSSLQFGVDFTERDKSNQLNTNVGKECNYFCGYNRPLRALGTDIFDAGVSGADSFPVDGLLSDTGASVPRTFLTFSPETLRALYSSATPGAQILDVNGNPTGAVEDFTGQPNVDGADIVTPRINTTGSNVINETVTGFYTQYNWAGELGSIPWSGNFGVRVAKTELESKGAVNQLLSVTPAPNGGQTFTQSAGTPVTITNSYTDTLPSLNLQFDLRDDLLLRVGASETLARPSLTNLSTQQVLNGTNVGAEAITTGNPELNPTKSENLDLSLEWYGDDSSAAVALFRKDISDFVFNGAQTEPILGINFQVNKPLNGESAEITGLELAYQKLFDNGFGFQVNATFTDSKSEFNGVERPFANVSDESFNISVFYEKDRVQARLALNNRGEYARTISSARQGLVEYVDDYAQLDFSASYDVTESLTAFVEGVNLTGEDELVFYGQGVSQQFPNLLRYYEDREPRINIGVRGSF